MAKKRTYRKFGPIPEEWGVHTDEPIYFDAKGRKRVDKKKPKDTNNTKTTTKEYKQNLFKLNDTSNLEYRSTPNLSDEERRLLMIDAYDRAREAGVAVSYNKQYIRLVYGYEVD